MKISGNSRLFLISNMYPSSGNIRYGIFVRNFENNIQDYYYVKKIVLTKKSTFLSKLTGYMIFYLKIISLYFQFSSKDIIYVHYPLHVAPALWPLYLFNKNIFLNFHGSDLIFDSPLKKILSYFLKPLIKKSLIVVPSNYYKRELLTLMGYEHPKTLVYPSGGINTKIFYPKKIVDNDTFKIGYVSNFIPEKGWKIFLDAVKIINYKNLINNLEVVMVGDGPDKYKIEKCLSEINVPFKLSSNIDQTELAKIYNSLDLFVFPTHRKAESLGLVGLEAMACGTPLIATNIAGPAEYVKDNQNGFLFQPNDVNDLVKKIVDFYNLTAIDKQIIIKNALHTSEEYDSEIVKKKLFYFIKNKTP